MRFLDANPFVYAFLRPTRRLNKSNRRIKEAAEAIIKRIDEGKEQVITSVVHLSEVANILGARLDRRTSSQYVQDVMNKPSVSVLDVSEVDYANAADIAVHQNVGVNDALILVLTEFLGINEVYPFDKGLDRLGLVRVES